MKTEKKEEEALFPDFHRVAGCIPPADRDSERQSKNTAANMKNPLFWAALVGMSVLLMEQGKSWTLVCLLGFFLSPRSALAPAVV